MIIAVVSLVIAAGWLVAMLVQIAADYCARIKEINGR